MKKSLLKLFILYLLYLYLYQTRSNVKWQFLGRGKCLDGEINNEYKSADSVTTMDKSGDLNIIMIVENIQK